MGGMLGRNATSGRSGYNLVFLLIFVFGTFVVLTHVFHPPTRELYRNAYYKVRPMVEYGEKTESSVEEVEPSGAEEGVTAPEPGALRTSFLNCVVYERWNLGVSVMGFLLCAEIQGGSGALEIQPSPAEEMKDPQDTKNVEEPQSPSPPPPQPPSAENKTNNSSDDVDNDNNRLTKELIESVARQGANADDDEYKGELAPVVVTWANYHYLDFVLNWVYHINATGCKTFLVGAMDDELMKVLLEKKIPSFAMSSGLSLNDFGWGSSTFFKMGREKISLLQTFTKWGYEVLISDVDTVWMKNPLPYVAKYPDADILVSSDHLEATVEDGGLEKFPDAGSAANIGIMLFRPKAAKFVDAWVDVLEKDENYWDQNAFNDLFKNGVVTSNDKDRLFLYVGMHVSIVTCLHYSEYH